MRVVLQWGVPADVRAELAAHLRGLTAPYLFIGSGFSARYAGAEAWGALLRRFADAAGGSYDYYFASADGDLPTVASLIARDLHEPWWREERFAAARAEREALGWAAPGQQSALKIEVARHLRHAPAALPADGPLAEELAVLRDVVVDGIITTNFDPVLETLFPDLAVFVGQDELLFGRSLGINELYKIHGSVRDPETLVLTAEDYARFADRNAYLAAKLLTMFVEHPIVFIGYSLQDRNVISILSAIARCLDERAARDLQDRLVFVTRAKGAPPSMGRGTIAVDTGSGQALLPIVNVVTDDFGEVFGALAAGRRRLPARLLRQLKQQVYELVRTSDPKGRLYVQDLEADTPTDDIDVVFGVGAIARQAELGYVGLNRGDLVDDLLAEDGGRLDPAAVVERTLPLLLRRSRSYVPVFKYLRAAGLLRKDGQLRSSAKVDPKIAAAVRTMHEQGIPPLKGYAKAAGTAVKAAGSFAELARACGDHTLLYATAFPADRTDPAQVRRYLLDHRAVTDSAEGLPVTQYYKLVCHYDWLVHGRPAD